MANISSTNDAVSLACKNLLASTISVTHRDGSSQMASVHSRRFRGGYDVIMENGRYTFEPQAGSPCFGDVMRRGERAPEATVRLAQGNGTRIDIAGVTYLVYGSHGSFAIDLVQERKRKRNTRRIGAARACKQSKSKTTLRSVPFTFDFKYKFPALLVPLLIIIIREAAATTDSPSSDPYNRTASYLLSAPSVAVSAAFGGAVH